MQPPSSARETVRDLLGPGARARWRERRVHSRGADERSDRAREARPSTATSPRTSRWRSRRRAGKPPRAVAEAIVARLPTGGGLAARRGHHRRPGVHQPAPLARVLAAAAAGDPRRGRRLGAGRRARGAEDRPRVPVGEPDRADHGRARAARRRRRLADAPAALRRLPGDAGVLHQRRRQPGADAGAVGLDPLHGDGARGRPVGARGRVPRERLQGRLHPRLRPRSLRARRHALGRHRAAGRHRADQAVRDRARAGDDPRDAGALRRRRSTSGRASARCTTPATSTRRCARWTPRATSIATTTPSG